MVFYLVETEEAAEEKQEHLIQLIVFGIFLELTQGGFELLRSSSATAHFPGEAKAVVATRLG